ncbi:WW domain-containing protein tag-325-like isoform X2 [Uranotaenia lowii]|uniref:WW domain-containing protein tag-325-like isoform X2 n=1 Tax=Uranotaenia lowii TaxID=190385 RepID=UPI0024788CE0|nr:WW domain-containing protein tag-325-like isoform X2 [Uranotaenia lowii]
MAYPSHSGDPNRPKNRPRNLFEGFTNRSGPPRRTKNQHLPNRESKSVIDSVSVVDQFRYLQTQHELLLDQHRKLKAANKRLESVQEQLRIENSSLKDAYEELQESYNNLLESQNHFNFGKLLVNLKLKRRATKENLVTRNIIQNEACFDTFLEHVVMHDRPKIPKIVHECIAVVESSEKFLNTVGLYRVSGNHNTIQNLRYDINADNYKKLRKQKSPHEVCGVLKLFLRELKEPLISLQQLARVIPGPSDMIHSRTLKVLELVNSLDEVRRNTLCCLMRHLKKVASHEENEMDTRSLGILLSSCVFNETLSDVCPERFEAVSAVPRECIVTMIENYEEIFEK